MDIATGARQLWRELMPADPAGVTRISAIRITPDGSAYAYAYTRILSSDLYVVEGFR